MALAGIQPRRASAHLQVGGSSAGRRHLAGDLICYPRLPAQRPDARPRRTAYRITSARAAVRQPPEACRGARFDIRGNTKEATRLFAAKGGMPKQATAPASAAAGLASNMVPLCVEDAEPSSTWLSVRPGAQAPPRKRPIYLQKRLNSKRNSMARAFVSTVHPQHG